MENIKENKNWFDEYDKPKNDNEYERLPIFEMKLEPGKLSRRETIKFLDEGHEATTRFGETIVFTIEHETVKKTWFIKKKQFSLLNPIAKLRKTGSIVGKTAVVERIGSGAKETKWNLAFN